MFKHTGTLPISTKRLSLGPFNKSHLNHMFYWLSDPLVQMEYGEPVYETMEECRALLDKWMDFYKSGNFYRWAVCLESTGENIGQIAFCKVYDDKAIAEIEYCIGRKYWGNGYAGEALNAVIEFALTTANFQLVEAFYRAENPRSGKVLEKSVMVKCDNAERYRREGLKPDNKIFYCLSRNVFSDNKDT